MEILSTVDGIITVRSGDKVYQVQETSFSMIEEQVALGADAGALLGLIAGANAKTAKVFDAEAAARKAEKALKTAALAEFEQELKDWPWSDSVIVLAETVTDLRVEQTQIEEIPFSISLEGYERNSPSKGCQRGEFRFTYSKGIPSLVVGLKEPLPRQMVIAHEVDVALHNFRTGAADEVTVPSVLKTENTSKDFDVDSDGSISYNVKVSTRGGGGNGGKRRKVMHIESGVVYASQTEAGLVYFPDVKYPHVKVRELAKKGETFRFIDD